MPASASSSAPSSARHLVIITGLSGSGKGSVLKTFEDQGYYAIDNLPVSLLSTFSQLLLQSAEIERAALVIDVREGSGLTRLPTLLGQLRQKSLRVTVLFLEATEASLVRRFSETRRPHPLGVAGVGVRAGIQAEMKTLARIRRQADLVVDTSQFTVHELREYITAKVIRAEGERAIRIALVSFGYRHGVPSDADLVFDVRFLPNPNYLPRLRNRTGQDPEVARYILSFSQSREFLDRITGLLEFLLPHYIQEGKSYLTIALGCTGGQHRSVMLAEAIARHLLRLGYKLKVQHRDMPRSSRRRAAPVRHA